MKISNFLNITAFKFSSFLFLVSLFSLISCNKEENQVSPTSSNTSNQSYSMSPYVKIIQPVTNSSVDATNLYSTPYVRVDASSPSIFEKVELFVDGIKVSESTIPAGTIYSLRWPQVQKGRTYQLTAVAIDRVKNRFTSPPITVSGKPSFSLDKGEYLSGDKLGISFDSYYTNINIVIYNKLGKILYYNTLSGMDFELSDVVSVLPKDTGYIITATGSALIPLPLTRRKFSRL